MNNIVLIISEELFRDQSLEYQNKTLGNLPIFGLTAGLAVTFQGLVGSNGKVFGFDHFGYSATASVLDEKFGFIGRQVADVIKKL